MMADYCWCCNVSVKWLETPENQEREVSIHGRKLKKLDTKHNNTYIKNVSTIKMYQVIYIKYVYNVWNQFCLKLT